jgi:hypothetical protein
MDLIFTKQIFLNAKIENLVWNSLQANSNSNEVKISPPHIMCDQGRDHLYDSMIMLGQHGSRNEKIFLLPSSASRYFHKIGEIYTS